MADIYYLTFRDEKVINLYQASEGSLKSHPVPTAKPVLFSLLHKPQTHASRKTSIGWPSLGQSSEKILDYMDYDDGSYLILGTAPDSSPGL